MNFAGYEKSESEQRFIELGWKLMEWKLMYYRPDLVHRDWHVQLSVNDQIYDKNENEYRELAKTLGREPTAVDMVDFDTTRPSSRLILDKFSQAKKKVRGKKNEQNQAN